MKTIIKMIDEISSIKSALVSITGAITGTAISQINYLLDNGLTIDSVLQRGAWTIAMLAGIVAIVNGVRKWKKPKDNEPKD